MDLSFLKGNSVNDCIDKNEYLGNKVDLHYPNVDKLVEIIKKKGLQCHIFKRDMRRAYRQFPLDPKDYNLVGFFLAQSYFCGQSIAHGFEIIGLYLSKNHKCSLLYC